MDELSPSKIAIVGTAPASTMLAPFDDKSWQIWACSAGNAGDRLPRVDIWFEMHAMVELMAAENKAGFEPYFKWLNEQQAAGKFQVVVLEFNKFLKGAPYPIHEMIETFGTRNWFTSTVAYMMALAIARGATEIGLFGVDMAAGQEHYEGQRAACTYWTEKAESMGIEVHVPFESCLKTATPMYGYWEGTPFGRRLTITRRLIQQNVAAIQQQKMQAMLQEQYFLGADEQIGYFQRTWTDGAEMPLDLGDLEERRLAAKLAATQAETAEAAERFAAAGVEMGLVAKPIIADAAPGIFTGGTSAGDYGLMSAAGSTSIKVQPLPEHMREPVQEAAE